MLGGKASEGQTPRKSTVSELGAKLATRDQIKKTCFFNPMMGLHMNSTDTDTDTDTHIYRMYIYIYIYI